MGWHHSICKTSLPYVQLLNLASGQNNHFNSWSYHLQEEKHYLIEASVVWLQGGGTQLPTGIKKSHNIDCFKAKLKTHLFKEYYKC